MDGIDKIFNQDKLSSFERTLNCYLCDGKPANCPNDTYLIKKGDNNCYWKQVLNHDVAKYYIGEELTFYPLPEVIKALGEEKKR